MNTVKAWIALGRPHTAALTIAVLTIGALAGYHESGRAVSYLALAAIAVWGAFTHWAGFAQNNVLDVEHDRQDPGKAHFPLVSGDINVHLARQVADSAILLQFTLGLLAVVVTHASSITPIILTLATWMGYLYNVNSKRSLLAPLFFCTYFALLPYYAFLLTGGPPANEIILLIVAFGWIAMLHQIAWCGYWKDLPSDPVNLLRKLGSYTMPPTTAAATRGVDAVRFASGKAQLFALTTRTITFWPLILLTQKWSQYAALFIGLAAAVLTLNLYMTKPNLSRRKILASIAIGEIITYYTLVAILTGPILTPAWAVALIILPLAWFGLWNRFLWGPGYWLAPKV